MEKAGIQKSAFAVIVALLILTGSAAYALRYMNVEPDELADFDKIPQNLNGWEAEEVFFSEATYDILKATETTTRIYHSDHELLPVLFIGYFKDQKYGSQIHSPRHCLPGSGWGILSHTQREIEVNGRTIPINYVLIGSRNQLQLMYYWFETRSGTITNEFGLKFNLFMNALFMKPTDAAFLRLTVNLPNENSIRQGEQILMSFLEDFLPAIEKSLPFEG